MSGIISAKQIYNGQKDAFKRIGNITQPLQFIPREEKDVSWTSQNMDWFERMGLTHVRRNARRLMKNYKLAQGIIDKSDYLPDSDPETSDLIDVLTDDDSTAFELKFYPLIPNVINTLVAEFAKRSTKVTFRTTDERSYSDMMQMKTSMVENALLQEAQVEMYQRLIAMGMEEDSEEFQQAMDPSQISATSL